MSFRLAVVVAILAGLFMLVHYFFSTTLSDLIYGSLLDYYQIILSVTMLVGGFALLRNHGKEIRTIAKNRIYSLATIAAMMFMLLSALIAGTGTESPYQWAFNNLQAPMQATTFSLLAFFVASSAYRGFRVRTLPALVLALSAVIVLIGRNVFGEMISDQLPQYAGWVLNVPSSAAKRGLLIGVGLGSVVTALRVVLGIDRNYG